MTHPCLTCGACCASFRVDFSVYETQELGGDVPDGLAVDAEGRLLVANPGLGYVWVLNDRAEPVQVMRGVPGSSITNLAFGGADRDQIYVTDSTHGRILRATLGVPGLPLHRAARH